MTTFQIIGLAVASLLALSSGISLLRRRTYGSGFWLLVALIAGVAIAWPDVTAVAADMLGIGRGADLVFYSGILASLRRRGIPKQMLVKVSQLLATAGEQSTVDVSLN